MKGSRVDQFSKGQRVKYATNVGHDQFRDEHGKHGGIVKVFVRKVSIMREDFGRIVKLHRSGRQGAAEIMPEQGGKKITRKLQHVTA